MDIIQKIKEEDERKAKQGDGLFSLYKAPINIIDKKPIKNISILDLYHLIKSDEYKLITEKVRKNLENKNEIKKKELDFITPAGVFLVRNKEGLISKSGYAPVDFDDFEKGTAFDYLEEIKKEPFVSFIFKSPSGNGLKLIVKIDNNKDYEQQVKAIYMYFYNKYTLTAKGQYDVARAGFLPFDDEVYLNPNAVNFEYEEIEEPEPYLSNVKKVELEGDKRLPRFSEITIKAMLKRLPCRGWGEHTFYVMMGLIHYSKHMNKDFFGLFRWWIDNFKGGITVEDMQKKWDEYYYKESKNPVTILSLIKEAKEHGYKATVETIDQKEKRTGAYENIMNDAEKIINKHYIIMDDNTGEIFIFDENEYRYKPLKKSILADYISEEMGAFYALPTKTRQEYVTAIEITARKKFRTLENINNQPIILFKGGKSINVEKNEERIITPNECFFCFSIPYEPIKGEYTQTRKFLDSYGIDSLDDLFAYLGINYNPKKIIGVWNGKNDTGKSTLQRYTNKLFGFYNCSSTNLQLLADSSQRFEAVQALKDKLICFTTELDAKRPYDTAILKSVSGGDSLRGEIKNKSGFSNFTFTGKLLILCNDIPQLSDTSDIAFMSRIMILDFVKQFERGSDPVYKIPEYEYNHYCYEMYVKVKEWANKGSIDIKGLKGIDERIKDYSIRSDPLGHFIRDFCNVDTDDTTECWKFREAFKTWQTEKGQKVWTDSMIGIKMNKLFEKTHNVFNDDGKQVWAYKNLEIYNLLQGLQGFDIRKPHVRNGLETPVNPVKPCKKNLIYEDFLLILKDNLSKTPLDVNYFYNSHLKDLISEDFYKVCIEKAKQQGDLFEPLNGYIQALT